MTQTPEIAVYGGFGSNDYQVNRMCEQISECVGCEAKGLSFSKALRDIESAACLLHGRQVISHSAGAMAVSISMTEFPEATPLDFLAVAPPYPVPAWILALRSTRVAENELRAGCHDRQQVLSNLRQTGALGRELLQHARNNFGEIPAISQFNTFMFASSLLERGIDARLAYMGEDELFPSNSVKFGQYLSSMNPRLEVLQIPGFHCEFAQNPVRALGAIASAQYLYASEAIPDLKPLQTFIHPEQVLA